ncbi:thioredoxin family protein [Ornithinibacillus halotolerans]|uniref:Thioredoxin n=1 Tax=Ornithinibacillus halotolerans TaxID=1274357 RepID=A0A916RYF6_9BACI|nr:thioredoxin family protein [Ornithinibacillus halotolerans]GGA76505.1 thioredoxin [Ornithinibacillus halotolerans]
MTKSLNDWFTKGIPSKDYVENMTQHKENLLHIYNSYTLPSDDEFFSSLKARKLRVIVLTEDWCGDAMMNTPVLLHLAEKTDMEVRMLPRDENLELMDQYLTNGKSRSIPIFIFIDEDGNEVAKWGPRAEEVQQFVDEMRKDLPEKEAEDYKEKFDAMIKTMYQEFLSNKTFWKYVYESMKTTLAK